VTGSLGFGVIGLGGISQAHFPGYAASPYADVVAVCDIDESVANATAAQLDATAYTHYEDLLNDSRVDAVDVILPHNLHHRVVADALEAGKHVLVEKPLALTYADCTDLISRAEQRRLTLSVAENTRFVKAYLEAERLLASGVLGEIRLVRTLISGSEVKRLRNPSLWKGRRGGSGGGAIIDAGPHSFYLLRWLFGEITVLRGFHDRLIDAAEVEDNGVVAGRLASGALFRSEFTFTAEVPWGERLEIYGSEGALIVDQLLDPPAVHVRGADDMTGEALAGVPFDPRGWKRESIALGVQDFAEALAEGRSPTVDARDGAHGVLVSELAYASADAGGIPIPFELPDGVTSRPAD
jgi:predicted dehydrogenase